MILVCEVVCQLLAVTGVYVCTCRIWELQLLRVFNGIFNTINNDFADPQSPMRWRDRVLIYRNGYSIRV